MSLLRIRIRPIKISVSVTGLFNIFFLFLCILKDILSENLKKIKVSPVNLGRAGLP